MKIAIDARLYGPQGTGIGKYTEKLIENLQELDKKNNYFIILNKGNWDQFKPKTPNFEKVMVDAPFYSLKEQAFIPAAISKIKPDIVHFTHLNVPLLYSGKFIVTIHDVITKDFSGVRTTTRALPVYLLKRAGYAVTLRQSVRRAAKIIVPSNYVRNRLIKSFPSTKVKAEVIYEGVDQNTAKASQKKSLVGDTKQILHKYKIKKPYLIYIGNYYPHKNVENLLQALQFVDRKYHLVLAGQRNIFLDRILKIAQSLKVENRLIITGFVPNKDLSVLYKQAEMFVFPSLSEGFGLPGLEAMASGCPVVCSNIPVFKEIYGDAVLYFDPRNPKDAAKKIETVIENNKLRTDLVTEGYKQLKKYSWRKMAVETLKVYQDLA